MGWGTGNVGSSSGGLNFKIVGGTFIPSNPKENTLWVNTDHDITSYIFSATEPESPAEGMVWISTGTSSPAEFNALKKNGIKVYPLSAKQRIDGAWVKVTAKSYQGGAWRDWLDYLLNGADAHDDITGGWETYKHFSGNYNLGTATFSGVGVTLDATNNKAVCITTKKKISFTRRSEMIVFVSEYNIASPINFAVYFTTAKMTDANGSKGYVAKIELSEGLNTIPIPDGVKNGEYYVNIGNGQYANAPQSATIRYIALQ